MFKKLRDVTPVYLRDIEANPLALGERELLTFDASGHFGSSKKLLKVIRSELGRASVKPWKADSPSHEVDFIICLHLQFSIFYGAKSGSRKKFTLLQKHRQPLMLINQVQPDRDPAFGNFSQNLSTLKYQNNLVDCRRQANPWITRPY